MRISLDELLTKIIIICSAVMLAFTGQMGINLSKYCLYLIVGLSFSKLLILRMRYSHLLALGITLVSSIIGLTRYGGNPASLLVFVSSLIFTLSVFNSGLSNSTWMLLKTCAVIVALWFVLMFLTEPTFSRDRLILSFDNPNMTGIALCAPAMVVVLVLSEAKNKRDRILCGALLVLLVLMVNATQNRGSLVTLVAFCVFAILADRKTAPVRVTAKWFYYVLKLMPIIVMIVYVWLYSVLPSDTEFLGKRFFSGREYSWQIALEQLLTNPFQHNYYEDGTLNLFLEGAARYTVFAMIGYFLLLFAIEKKDLKTAPARNYLAYLGFHLCLFQQSFESTLLTGSYSVYIWTYILLGVSSMKEAEDRNSRHRILF